MAPQLTEHPSQQFEIDFNTGDTLQKRMIEVGQCNVNEIGLERFIRRIVKELDLHLEDDVVFNLNDLGILYKWKEVFEVEQTYSQCLGILKRCYQCHGYTHEPQKGLTYFILEEENKRMYSFLPDFKFHVLVFCYYDARKAVTRVDVRYDQMSFFLHCFGMIRIHTWIVSNIMTPLACAWMRKFTKIAPVNPMTFLANVLLIFWIIYRFVL